MIGDVQRRCGQVIEALLEHPNGMTIDQAADYLGRKRMAVRTTFHALKRSGHLEQVRASRKGRTGSSPDVWRIGPRIRSLVIDAGQTFRVELVGEDPQSGREARPTNPQRRGLLG